MSILPRIAFEGERLIANIPLFAAQAKEMFHAFEASTGLNIGSQTLVEDFIERYSISDLGKGALDYLRNTGAILIKSMIGIILSYVFIIDRRALNAFISQMKGGSFGFMYREFSYLGSKIGYGFGRVFKAQSLIAVVNAILTTLGLIVIAYMF